MKPLLAILVLLALPASALAGTASYDGATLRFTAAPGEVNYLTLKTTTSCAGLAAPCLSVADSPSYPLVAPPGCVADDFLGIRCPLPESVVLDLGDGIDWLSDWDGPSVVHGGPDGDVIRGNDGNDVLEGDDGRDVLIGGPGDDVVSGGPGGDVLESYMSGLGLDGPISPADTAGADTLRGGADNDIADYEARTDPLTIVLDGQPNDGAPGERDNIASDVEIVQGGSGGDALTGNRGPNVLAGLGGNDTIRGAGGDDELDGGNGNDTVLGGNGSDSLFGGPENDVLDGGRGSDRVYGEYATGCGLLSCVGGSDLIRARDGRYDSVDCGAGTDRAILDRVDRLIDATDCERVRRRTR
jgi:Ca2+-binding RTX toxin-like protein